MTMEIPILDKAGLRKFGLMTGAIVVALFAFFFPWVFDMTSMPRWPWVIAVLLWVSAMLMPSVLHPIYINWMKIGLVLGWINTRIILGILFYIMILPMGLIMRLLGHDPMVRKKDKAATSYRIQSQSEAKNRMEKPY